MEWQVSRTVTDASGRLPYLSAAARGVYSNEERIRVTVVVDGRSPVATWATALQLFRDTLIFDRNLL